MGAIYLSTTTNLQGRHELMDLVTWILIKLTKFYPCVMTKIFIKAFEKLAEYQRFKIIKLLNRKRKKIIFPDADLLKGVEWVHNDNETDDTQ